VPLAPFSTVDLSALRWLKTEEGPVTFALLSGDQTIEELRWSKSTGSLARAEVVGSAWTLKRVGFLNPHLTLRVAGEATDSARVTLHFDPAAGTLPKRYHRIDFVPGPRFRFRRAGIQVPAWKVTTDDRNDAARASGLATTDDQVEIAHIEPVREGRKLVGGAVLVSEAGRGRPELPAVLAFVWYAIVLAWFEDELLLPLEELGLDLPARD
jgi:hypothetical protein